MDGERKAAPEGGVANHGHCRLEDAQCVTLGCGDGDGDFEGLIDRYYRLMSVLDQLNGWLKWVECTKAEVGNIREG